MSVSAPMTQLLSALASVEDQASPQDQPAPLVLTYGGTETVILFDLNHDLSEFAAFVVPLSFPQVQTRLEETFYDPLAQLAIEANAPLVMDACTWRASPDYLAKLGFNEPDDIKRVNSAAVAAQIRIRDRWAPKGLRGIISGEIGPRGDGYKADSRMSAAEAMAYHTPQVLALKDSGVELISAATMTHIGEALGLAMAAANAGLSLSLGVTVETNGQLPDGTALSEFVKQVDAELDELGLSKPLFFMVNCAHPTHFHDVLDVDVETEEGAWRKRVRAIRANASCKSHAELDESEEVDNGDIEELGRALAAWNKNNGIVVVGGCCGTDVRHIQSIVKHLL